MLSWKLSVVIGLQLLYSVARRVSVAAKSVIRNYAGFPHPENKERLNGFASAEQVTEQSMTK